MSAKEINVGAVRVSPCASRSWRTRLGALLSVRVRRRTVGFVDGGRVAARTGAGGISRDRVSPSRKGISRLGSDVTTTDSPFEAGLGFAVKIKKGEFIGRDALDRAGEPTRRLACLVLDEAKSVVLGSEPVRFEGRALGA